MRACLVAGSRECKDQAVMGQMRLGGAVFLSFHLKISMHLTEEGKDHFTGWKIETWGTGATQWRSYKKWITHCQWSPGYLLEFCFSCTSNFLAIDYNFKDMVREDESLQPMLYRMLDAIISVFFGFKNLQINEISSRLTWSSEILDQPIM